MAVDPGFLASISLFQQLDDDERSVLASAMQERSVKAGEVLFNAGDPGDSMFIVHTGQVELFVKDKAGQKIVLHVAEPGEFFGELSLLDGGSRTATGVAVAPSDLWILDREDGLARSTNGFQFTVDPEPFLIPARDGPFAAYEEFGVEDPRVTQVEGDFLITYSAYSRNGVRIALARTKDFRQVERISLITQADYRNVVIFPEKFDGLYVRLDRPHSEIAPWSIWISYSPDLRFWGESQLIMRPEPYHWDEMKIGPGAPPIKTDQGWLSIYHGVFQTMDGSVYRLGVALHDLRNPAKVIGVGDSWILQPEDPWEITGYVHNVVFTCGAIPESNGTVKIYWGGADTVMCAGEANASDLVALCLEHGRLAK